MPEVLELKPLKKKKLKLIVVESEFPIDWWFETPDEAKNDLILSFHLVSREYLKLIGNLIETYGPDFALEERGMRNNSIEPEDPLVALFKEKNIPFKFADISENACDYLSSALEEHRESIKKLEKRIKEILESVGTNLKSDFNFQRLMLWTEYLRRDYQEQEEDIRFKVREAWMMMNILNLAKEVEGKKLKGLFLCDFRHFDGIEKLANELGVELEQIKIKRTLITEDFQNKLEDDVQIEI